MSAFDSSQDVLAALRRAVASHQAQSPAGKRLPAYVRTEAAKLMASGMSAEALAQESGLKAGTLNRWRKQSLSQKDEENRAEMEPHVVAIVPDGLRDHAVTTNSLKLSVGFFDVTIALAGGT